MQARWPGIRIRSCYTVSMDTNMRFALTGEGTCIENPGPDNLEYQNDRTLRHVDRDHGFVDV